MKRIIWIVIILGTMVTASVQAQKTTRWNFSRASQPVSGWVNVAGDPSTGLVTVADPSTGFSINSVAPANWAPFGVGCSYDGGGTPNGTFFPAAVMMNQWSQYSNYYALYNAAMPQFKITGLKVDSVYTLKMTGSFNDLNELNNCNPTRYTVAGTTVYGFVDVNASYNTANGAIFNNIAPDATGTIRVYVNTYNGSTLASINGIQIIEQRTTAPTPVVSITHPSNNDVLLEDNGDVIINANASESGGSIARIEFYINGVKMAQDSVAPYSYTWPSPDEGKYELKARAIDGLGNVSTSTINVSVEALSSFWSMTGNIHMNPDSNFIGNVDSVRLAFRTKNIERMTLSANGELGIGTKAPTAQLHTTGSVKFSGLTSDSTQSRVIVSDTSGKLYYRNVSSLSNRWQYVNGVLYDSADAIAIGTNNPQGYKLAVNGAAIFTKVKVKTAGTWPDYVFNADYKLPELAELERYLAQYKHLPDIASEAEVIKDGIDVGDHQAAVLKKVEELTLYLIEENKKLKEQQDTLNSQHEKLMQQQAVIENLLRKIEALENKAEQKK